MILVFCDGRWSPSCDEISWLIALAKRLAKNKACGMQNILTGKSLARRWQHEWLAYQYEFVSHINLECQGALHFKKEQFALLK